MTIETSFSSGDSVLNIIMENKFDFSKVQEFKNAYVDLKSTTKNVVIDMQKTEYMDSSALGMLLNMQKSIGDAQIKYDIINCQEQILRILKISRFDKKFNIR